MSEFIDILSEATVVKKFLDELEKNPRRTLMAVAAVLLLTGAGIRAALATGSPNAPLILSELPSEPAKYSPDGKLLRLPEPRLANEALGRTLDAQRARNSDVESEINSREPNAPVTEREINIIYDSGKVSY